MSPDTSRPKACGARGDKTWWSWRCSLGSTGFAGRLWGHGGVTAAGVAAAGAEGAAAQAGAAAGTTAAKAAAATDAVARAVTAGAAAAADVVAEAVAERAAPTDPAATDLLTVGSAEETGPRPSSIGCVGSHPPRTSFSNQESRSGAVSGVATRGGTAFYSVLSGFPPFLGTRGRRGSPSNNRTGRGPRRRKWTSFLKRTHAPRSSVQPIPG